MASFSVGYIVQTPQRTINQSLAYSASAGLSIYETLAHSGTRQIMCNIDVSAVKGFTIMSDQDVTIKTNSSGSPDDTIELNANQPYVWFTDAYDDFLLTVDVTSLYVVIAGAVNANITIEAVYDATP